MATEKILNDGLRAKYTDVIREALAQAGYDVLQVGTNELCIPALDADRNDKYVTFTIKVPTGERGGDPYDGYGRGLRAEAESQGRESQGKGGGKAEEDGTRCREPRQEKQCQGGGVLTHSPFFFRCNTSKFSWKNF